MPLDNFQISMLAVLMRGRSPDSVCAGGTVLHRHGYRLSSDQDIFHASGTNLAKVADSDVKALQEAGFAVEVGKVREGLYEAVVAKEGEGFTKVQWVESGSWNFFMPVPDEQFGWRLHMADLAINKVLAAGGRRQVRDYVDLCLIHRHIMPLWLAIWAAPGKDESWSPESLAEKIARTNGFRQEEVDEGVLATIELSASDIGSTVREAIEEAREVFRSLPDEHAGKLFVGENGELVTDIAAISHGASGIRPLEATQGGTWPSESDIDSALIRRVVDAYGWEGSAPDAEYDPSVAITAK